MATKTTTEEFVPFTDDCEACGGTGSIAVAWGWNHDLQCRVPTDVECDACEGTRKAARCDQCEEAGADFRDGWGDGEFWCTDCREAAVVCKTGAEDCAPALPPLDAHFAPAFCSLCRERHAAEDRDARERDDRVWAEVQRRGCGLKGGA